MLGPWVRVPAGSHSGAGAAFFMPFMYILFSEKLNKYYVGACTDMQRRLYEHNIGHSRFTSLGTPWLIAYKEEFATLAEAKKRELQVKKMKSRNFIESLIEKNKLK